MRIAKFCTKEYSQTQSERRTMSEVPHLMQLHHHHDDDVVLDILVHRLANDRSVRVAAFLPHLLARLTEGEPRSGAYMRGEPRVRWEQAKASALAVLLQRALDNEADAAMWSAAYDEWNTFVHLLESGGQWQHASSDEHWASLKSLARLAVQALSPLLGFLEREDGGAGENCQRSRVFYSRAVSSLLQIYLGGLSDGERTMWLRRYDWSLELHELLQPFLSYEMKPLERELAFHFQLGKKTARRDEPQHFFSFLLQLYGRYIHSTRTHGWAPPCETGTEASTLIALGSVTLAWTAASLFRTVYGWHESSALLLAANFAVHGVNCFVDFLNGAECVVHRAAQLLLAESILFPSVFDVYLNAAKRAVERAFDTGAGTLWRVEFLSCESPRAPDMVSNTRHMLRCLEAVIRRFSVVFALLPSYTSIMWEQIVVSSTTKLVGALTVLRETTLGSLSDTIVLSLQLLGCVHSMHAALEEWLDRCSELSGRKDITSSTIDRLALWRDELTRETTRSVTRFLTRLFGPPDLFLEDLHVWDRLLHSLCQGEITAHNIIYEDMKLSLGRLTTEEQRIQLRDYCQCLGMEAVVTALNYIDA